jgi:hypothetical protein
MNDLPTTMVTTLTGNDSLIAIRTTTERDVQHRVQERTMRIWILLTSLAATVFGWMALPSVAPSPKTVVLSPKLTVPNADVSAPPVRAEAERTGSTVRPMPTMPQKPVFQAPVTRTRRS